MKIVIGVTGASGLVYAGRLIEFLSGTSHEVDVVVSEMARAVNKTEGGIDFEGIRFPMHDDKDLTVPFISGSARYDAMAVVPCSMASLGKIANGISDTVITRTADVFLKERRRLVIVPRETSISLIHVRNMESVILAGARVVPACPSFYSSPKTVSALVDTVVARILDNMDVENDLAPRWAG